VTPESRATSKPVPSRTLTHPPTTEKNSSVPKFAPDSVTLYPPDVEPVDIDIVSTRGAANDTFSAACWLGVVWFTLWSFTVKTTVQLTPSPGPTPNNSSCSPLLASVEILVVSTVRSMRRMT
jgi:hypothetical protein